jgi:hypothetical protein
MRYYLLLAIVFALPIQAMELKDTYWSTWACGGYIYYFDPSASKFKIYTKLQVRDDENSEYNSYQFTSGLLVKSANNLYTLDLEDGGQATVEFDAKNSAIMKSVMFGQSTLTTCDTDQAKQLITEAEKHFETCPRDVLNCKSL